MLDFKAVPGTLPVSPVIAESHHTQPNGLRRRKIPLGQGFVQGWGEVRQQLPACAGVLAAALVTQCPQHMQLLSPPVPSSEIRICAQYISSCASLCILCLAACKPACGSLVAATASRGRRLHADGRSGAQHTIAQSLVSMQHPRPIRAARRLKRLRTSCQPSPQLHPWRVCPSDAWASPGVARTYPCTAKAPKRRQHTRRVLRLPPAALEGPLCLESLCYADGVLHGV